MCFVVVPIKCETKNTSNRSTKNFLLNWKKNWLSAGSCWKRPMLRTLLSCHLFFNGLNRFLKAKRTPNMTNFFFDISGIAMTMSFRGPKYKPNLLVASFGNTLKSEFVRNGQICGQSKTLHLLITHCLWSVI